MATKAKSKSGKSDKEKLTAGAKEIEKAKKELAKAKPEPLVLKESTRDIREIVNERVTVLPGSIGVKLADETPIEECLRIMDWAQAMSDHVGFMIGDIINFGSAKWGDKYQQAMEQTGRAYATLAHYAMTARRIPADKRVPALSFSHHREALRIGDDAKIAKVLVEAGEQAEKGKLTTLDFRAKIAKSTPAKVKKPKKATSGKGKAKRKVKEVPPYKPTAAEQEKLEEAEIAMEEASKLISKLFPIVGKLDNAAKKRWLKLAEPFVTFYNAVDKITGY